jgi:hypothetical protein
MLCYRDPKISKQGERGRNSFVGLPPDALTCGGGTILVMKNNTQALGLVMLFSTTDDEKNNHLLIWKGDAYDAVHLGVQLVCQT